MVRRTFLEVETAAGQLISLSLNIMASCSAKDIGKTDGIDTEDDEEIDFDCSERHGRRYRTVNSLCTDRSDE